MAVSNSWSPDDGGMASPLVIGHRGNSLRNPEQTLAAFESAALCGADMVEADVRFTRDDRLVLMHDRTVDRTTSGSGPVADLTWRELRRLDAGAWFGREFAGEVVPSLDELVALAVSRGLGLCLEVKGETSDEQERTARAVAEVMASAGRLDSDVLASFDHRTLGRVASEVPGLRTAPDRLPERGVSSVEQLVDQARLARADLIQHHHLDLSPSVVDGLHHAGLVVWAWPTTKVRDILAAASLGVDALMGDDVQAVRDAVDRLRDAGRVS